MEALRGRTEEYNITFFLLLDGVHAILLIFGCLSAESIAESRGAVRACAAVSAV